MKRRRIICGISGVLNGEKSWNGLSDLNKYMKQAATVGVLRGEDSTGIFQVRKDNSVAVHKLALPGHMFVDTKRANALLSNVDGTRCTIMHHRAATRGSINHENSHPFEHSDQKRYLIGVHNGSLSNSKTYYDGINFEVDSDYAFYRIFKEGKAAFKHLNGAYALVWYENDGRVRIACNGERQFSFAPVVGKNVILIASEPGMLYWLAERNDLKVEAIVTPEPHNLLTFNLEGNLREFESEPIDKPQVEVVASANFHQGTRTAGKGATGAGTTQHSANVRDGNSTRIIDPSSDSLFLKYGLGRGDEVEFFPDRARCEPMLLKGHVVVDEKKFELVPAILALTDVAMYNNVKANSVNSLITTVRGESTSYKGSTKEPILLLDKINIALGAEGVIIPPPPPIELFDTEKYVLGPKSRPLTHQGFLSLVDGGCMNCKEPITLKDGLKGDIGWNGNSPICVSCLADIAREVA